MEHLRQRDAERMDMEAAGGLFAGRSLVLGRTLARKEPQDGPAPAAS